MSMTTDHDMCFQLQFLFYFTLQFPAPKPTEMHAHKGFSSHITESLTVDHCRKRPLKMLCFLHVKDIFHRFLKRIGTLLTATQLSMLFPCNQKSLTQLSHLSLCIGFKYCCTPSPLKYVWSNFLYYGDIVIVIAW